jgi:sigma-B regulation protein RsbU (phosphoserine phosphatase)
MVAPQATVLLVDDEELNRDGLARGLQRHDYEVVAAGSGDEAIELLCDRQFDLVLLDIMMPGMNGLEVLKFLRRIDSLVDLPIIMVTAKGESQAMVEALELGANDYVTKPLDMPVALARIRTQLALRRAVAQVKDLQGKLDAHNRELRAASEALAAANDRHTRDLEAAARVQQAVLPALLPEIPGARFAWAFEPCGQVAGDYLNVFRLGDRHAGLCVLNVPEHGVAAALLSVILSQRLTHVVGGAGAGVVPPAEVAARLAGELTPEATAGHTFSLLYGVLACDTGEFRFISAGHPGPVYLPRDALPIHLAVTGFPVGLGTRSYKEQAMNLRPGDRVVLYTDGVTEVRNADGEHFGMRRFLATLEQSRGSSLDKSRDALVKSVEGWRNDTPRHHDLSILFVERTDPGGAAATESTPTCGQPSRSSGQHPLGKKVP